MTPRRSITPRRIGTKILVCECSHSPLLAVLFSPFQCLFQYREISHCSFFFLFQGVISASQRSATSSPIHVRRIFLSYSRHLASSSLKRCGEQRLLSFNAFPVHRKTCLWKTASKRSFRRSRMRSKRLSQRIRSGRSKTFPRQLGRNGDLG